MSAKPKKPLSSATPSAAKKKADSLPPIAPPTAVALAENTKTSGRDKGTKASALD